jgi:hypothetical protein
MLVQRTCVSARGTGSGRPLRLSEVQALLEELANLRDMLAGIADRLAVVEVPAVEQTRAVSLSLLPSLTPTPTPTPVPVPASLRAPADADMSTLALLRERHGHGRVIPLKLLRLSRGWTQRGLIRRMRALAAQQGVRLPDEHSFKTMLSRWENGRRAVSPFYLELFGRLFQQHPALTTSGGVDAADALDAAVAA